MPPESDPHFKAAFAELHRRRCAQAPAVEAMRSRALRAAPRGDGASARRCGSAGRPPARVRRCSRWAAARGWPGDRRRRIGPLPRNAWSNCSPPSSSSWISTPTSRPPNSPPTPCFPKPNRPITMKRPPVLPTLILTALAAGSLWQSAFAEEPSRRPPAAPFMLFPFEAYAKHREAIGLNEDQVKEMGRIAEGMGDAARKLENERRERTEALQEAVSQHPIDMEKAMTRFQAVLQAENEMKALQFRSGLAVQNLLSPEQAAKAQAIAAKTQGSRDGSNGKPAPCARQAGTAQRRAAQTRRRRASQRCRGLARARRAGGASGQNGGGEEAVGRSARPARHAATRRQREERDRRKRAAFARRDRGAGGQSQSEAGRDDRSRGAGAFAATARQVSLDAGTARGLPRSTRRKARSRRMARTRRKGRLARATETRRRKASSTRMPRTRNAPTRSCASRWKSRSGRSRKRRPRAIARGWRRSPKRIESLLQESAREGGGKNDGARRKEGFRKEGCAEGVTTGRRTVSPRSPSAPETPSRFPRRLRRRRGRRLPNTRRRRSRR